MKNIIGYLLLALILLGLGSCATKKLTRIGVYRELSAQEFAKLIDNENINIIDVRTASEYKKSHIKGALHASYLSGHFSKIISNYNLDTANLTLIYCETQHRSLFAAKQLYKLGFNKIIDLDKGMMFWRKEKLPYISEKFIKN